jgi:hypothetical protein
MAKIDWSFLQEGFALASGAPPSAWRTPLDEEDAVVQRDHKQLPGPEGRQAKTSPRKLSGKRGAPEMVVTVRRIPRVLLAALKPLR